MEKSIETIWKEGFLESGAIVAPKLNNLYNQKSKHLVDKLKRMFKINLIAIYVMAIAFLIIYYFIDAMWQGVCAAILLLSVAWYSKRLMQRIKTLDQDLNCYDYLKSFDEFLKKTLAKNAIVMRFFYPLIFLTAASTIWFGGDNQKALTNKLLEKFPDLIFVGGLPMIGLITVGIITLLIAYFSDKIYRWDVGLVYGRIFKKLEETIAEMEKLKS